MATVTAAAAFEFDDNEHEGLSAPPPPTQKQRDDEFEDIGEQYGDEQDYGAEDSRHHDEEYELTPEEEEEEARFHRERSEEFLRLQHEQLQHEDDEDDDNPHHHHHQHLYDQQEYKSPPQQQPQQQPPQQQSFPPQKTTFDLESQQHIQVQDTPQASPGIHFAKLQQQPLKQDIPQNSSASHFARPSYTEDPMHPPPLNRNNPSFDTQPQTSPVRNFSQPASSGHLHGSYSEQQPPPPQQQQQQPTSQRISQDLSQSSPIHNFSKPVPIPSRSYESEGGSSSMQFSGSFRGQHETSGSHQSSHMPLPGTSPNEVRNMSSSYTSIGGPPETTHFPPHLPMSPVAAPNQTPAFAHPQPFQPPAVGGHQQPYVNLREAQPAQHVAEPGTSVKSSHFPEGWNQESELQESPQKQSTNPFSPEIKNQHPFQQPPPPPAPQQQTPQSLPLGISPPAENLRSLQEGSIGEGRSFSQRSNGSMRSAQEVVVEKPSVIGRPTPPSQPVSQQSHHSMQSHQSQQPQRNHAYPEQPRYAHSNTSPQSNHSAYAHGPPPAIPPKQPLDLQDREREHQDRERERESQQRAAAFSYQQHLKRHLANASTSPRGLTGYGPPPTIPPQGREQMHAPRVTSPLSVRREEPSSYRPPPPPQRQDEESPHSQHSQHSHHSQGKGSPHQERKVSFGRKHSDGSPKQGYGGAGGTSPQHSQRGSQYNGSPHGSMTGSTANKQPYSPPRHQQQQQHAAPSPPPSADYHHGGHQGHQSHHEMRGDTTGMVTSQPQAQRVLFGNPMLSNESDGVAPPQAPSCPPPDTPIDSSNPRGPPGGYLKSIFGAGVVPGKPLNMPPLVGKKFDSREEGDGGTPTGFLPKASRMHARKVSSERGPPPLGARPRGASGSSGLRGMERPPSAEGDDPIPPEYRPRAEKKDEVVSPSKKDKPYGLGLESGPAQQMQQLRRPPPLGSAQRSPEKVTFGRAPQPQGVQQRSPAEVGLGGYLYSKPIPPPSVGNSGTSNPRFPGGHITSPLTQTLSPLAQTMSPSGIGTKESVMRGQWVDDTAAIAGPAPVRKDGMPPPPPQPIYGGFENGGDTSGAFKAYTQGFQKRQSPEEEEEEDVVDDTVTNPSASPTPEIPHIPMLSAQHDHSKRGVGSEEALFRSLSERMPHLPHTHINSLLNFALYLAEDNILTEKAERIKMQNPNGPGVKSQLELLGDQRMRRFDEWSEMEKLTRNRQATMMTMLPPPPPQESDNRRQPDEQERYQGMQPLPPPPKLSDLDEFGPDKYRHQQPHHRRESTSTYNEVPREFQMERHETPSPTPTVDQVAAAPKVDLELQMPRPMPSIPANRIDPAARRRLVDDDASTVTSETPGHHKDPSMDLGLPGGTPYPFPFPKRHGQDYAEGRPVDTKVLQNVISSFTRAKSNGGNVVDDAELMADIPPFLHMAYAALEKTTNTAPLDQYIENSKRTLDQKTTNRINTFNHDSNKRRAVHQNNTAALANTGRLTYADLERMREQFEQDEAARKMELDNEIYAMFENDFVEVAYKEVKAQLEELGGRWYEEVKNWLFSISGTGTALEYHLILEAIDLLNKLHVTMEEHEHVLQSLVTDRNARYLQISVAPLLVQGETVRAADAERRYWIDEQERQIRSKIERGKRVAEHRNTVDRVAERVVDGLRKKYQDVLEAVWAVVFQFPPAMQPALLRKFFDETTLSQIQPPANTSSHHHPPTNVVPPENLQVLADAVQTLGEILGLIKLACDTRTGPAIRTIESQIAIDVAQDHARTNGVTAPAATATACAKNVKLHLPASLKRVADEMRSQTEAVVQTLVEVLERLRVGVTELARQGGRVDFDVPSVPVPKQKVSAWENGSGEAWVTGYTPAPAVQQARGYTAGGLSVATLMGGFRVSSGNGHDGVMRWANDVGAQRQGGAQNMLVSPGGYSPGGYSPAVVSAAGGVPWQGGQGGQY